MSLLHAMYGCISFYKLKLFFEKKYLNSEKSENKPRSNSLFAFNGKEKDNEIKGIGNSLDFGARIYDSRLGKFLSIDPLSRKYAMLTPYQFASNSPIMNIDIDGLEGTKPSPPKSNVIILIASDKEMAEKDLKYTNTAGKNNHGQWDVIVSTNMVDAAGQMKERYSKESVKNLIVHSHGSNAGDISQITTDGNKKLGIRPQTLEVFNNNPSNETDKPSLRDETFQQVKALVDVSSYVAENGNLIMGACMAGYGEEGQKMGDQLNIATGQRINTFLNKDYSTYTTNEGYGLNVTTGGITERKNLRGGWLQVKPNGTQVNIRDKNSNGNIYTNRNAPAPPVSLTPSKQ